MGRVYRAERVDGSGPVAVKILNEDCTDNADLRERFEREARALFGLAHPNILDVQDYGVLDGRQPYLVMELLTGQTLESLIEKEPLDPALALELARQLLSGLAFAHSQGVLHRDLKTENIFVLTQPNGSLRAKLLDFGLVKFVDDDRWGEARKLTVAGSVMGSPAYMSPEQGTGGAMDARSDVYSAGVVLYELLTGTWPFVTESRVEMLKAHLLSPVPPLAAGRPGLIARPELDALIAKAMAKEAGDRFRDAGEMLAALDAIPRPAAWLASASQGPMHGPVPIAPAQTTSAVHATAAPSNSPQRSAPNHATAVNPLPVASHAKSVRSASKLPLLAAAGLIGFCALATIAAAVAFVLTR